MRRNPVAWFVPLALVSLSVADPAEAKKLGLKPILRDVGKTLEKQVKVASNEVADLGKTAGKEVVQQFKEKVAEATRGNFSTLLIPKVSLAHKSWELKLGANSVSIKVGKFTVKTHDLRLRAAQAKCVVATEGDLITCAPDVAENLLRGLYNQAERRAAEDELHPPGSPGDPELATADVDKKVRETRRREVAEVEERERFRCTILGQSAFVVVLDDFSVVGIELQPTLGSRVVESASLKEGAADDLFVLVGGEGQEFRVDKDLRVTDLDDQGLPRTVGQCKARTPTTAVAGGSASAGSPPPAPRGQMRRGPTMTRTQ